MKPLLRTKENRIGNNDGHANEKTARENERDYSGGRGKNQSQESKGTSLWKGGKKGPESVCEREKVKIGIETYPLKYVYMYIKNRETEKQAGGARDERKEVCSRETMENSAGETGKREGARERGAQTGLQTVAEDRKQFALRCSIYSPLK